MSDMGLRYGTGTLNDMNYIRNIEYRFPIDYCRSCCCYLHSFSIMDRYAAHDALLLSQQLL